MLLHALKISRFAFLTLSCLNLKLKLLIVWTKQCLLFMSLLILSFTVVFFDTTKQSNVLSDEKICFEKSFKIQ